MQCTNDFKSILEEFLKGQCKIEHSSHKTQDLWEIIVYKEKELQIKNFDDYYNKIFLANLIEELKILTNPKKSKNKNCSHAKTVFQVCFARPNLDISEPESIKAIANSIVIALYNLYPQGLPEKTLKKLFNFVQEHSENFLEIIGYKTESIYDQ